MATIVSSRSVTSEHHVGRHPVGLAERIGHVGDGGILPQRRHVAEHVGHRHQVRGVLHELADRPMVGMIVAGAVGEHQIRGEGADLADHPLADLEGRHQLAVGDVPGFVGGADDPPRGGGLRPAKRAQLPPAAAGNARRTRPSAKPSSPRRPTRDRSSPVRRHGIRHRRGGPRGRAIATVLSTWVAPYFGWLFGFWVQLNPEPTRRWPRGPLPSPLAPG